VQNDAQRLRHPFLLIEEADDYIVLVTTDLSLNGKLIVKHYEQRSEIEQDYEQLKSGGWLLQKLTSTRYSQIVFYFLTVVLSCLGDLVSVMLMLLQLDERHLRLPSEDLEKKFIKEATAAGLDGLKGHRSVGGLRA